MAASFPDPLTLENGSPVASTEDWVQKRAPELRRIFQSTEYGFLPARPKEVNARLEREDTGALGGKATLQELQLTWGMPAVSVHLLLVVPHRGTTPAPVFLGLNFRGNHTVLADAAVRRPDAAAYPEEPKGGIESLRGSELDVWNVEQTIDRGYAFATFFTGDVVPDSKALAGERLKLFRPADRSAASNPDDCATLAAWAWGLMRGVDYLCTNPAIDARRIAVVGHSRNGKAALLAAAMDDRIALAIPLQAGCGGTAPSRVAPELGLQADGHSIAETIKRINTNFPHWFCDAFKQYNDAPEKLPIDQHELLALCAPRPVLVSAATEDLWANPEGQFDMVRRADPVYRLICGDGAASSQMPAVGELKPSRLAFFIRPGKHSMTKVDWDAFLTYADRWLR